MGARGDFMARDRARLGGVSRLNNSPIALQSLFNRAQIWRDCGLQSSEASGALATLPESALLKTSLI